MHHITGFFSAKPQENSPLQTLKPETPEKVGFFDKVKSAVSVVPGALPVLAVAGYALRYHPVAGSILTAVTIGAALTTYMTRKTILSDEYPERALLTDETNTDKQKIKEEENSKLFNKDLEKNESQVDKTDSESAKPTMDEAVALIKDGEQLFDDSPNVMVIDDIDDYEVDLMDEEYFGRGDIAQADKPQLRSASYSDSKDGMLSEESIEKQFSGNSLASELQMCKEAGQVKYSPFRFMTDSSVDSNNYVKSESISEAKRACSEDFEEVINDSELESLKERIETKLSLLQTKLTDELLKKQKLVSELEQDDDAIEHLRYSSNEAISLKQKDISELEDEMADEEESSLKSQLAELLAQAKFDLGKMMQQKQLVNNMLDALDDQKEEIARAEEQVKKYEEERRELEVMLREIEQ